MDDEQWLADRFEEHRGHLRAVAYRMLGSLTEADDAVQDTWLRLSRSGGDQVQDLRGWLTTVVARVCLNMLRARNVRREEGLGVRLPDPLVSTDDELQPELQANWLTPAELDMLSSMRGRDRATRWARRRGGRAARRALTNVQEAASELAFARDRVERGLAPVTAAADNQRRLAEALTEFRRLTAGAARTAEATG